MPERAGPDMEYMALLAVVQLILVSGIGSFLG